MKINKIKIVLMTVFLSLIGVVGFGQVAALEKPAANLTEKWDVNMAGWTTNDSQCGWTNGALAIRCKADAGGFSQFPSPSLLGLAGASGDIFFGNYSNIEAVSFDVDVQAYDFTNRPAFYFVVGGTGKKWRYHFLNSYVNGQKFSINIPFSYSPNWVSGFVKSNDAEMFNADRTNVSEVGFEFVRGPNDLQAQQLHVDNLKLIGPWGGPFSNDVPLAWVMESGLTNDFGLAGLVDSDNDSFSNAQEFLAGTDPTNASSFFKIEIVRNDAGQMVVKWKGNRNAEYELREANSLGSDGGFVTKTNISSTSVKSEEIVVDKVGSNSKFFKVLIRPSK